jgi:putative oxidoreductase
VSAAAGVVVVVGRVLFALYFGAVASVATSASARTSRGTPRRWASRWCRWRAGRLGAWLMVAGLSVALGVWPDVGVLMIALFVAVAAFFFHAYWQIEDATQKMNQNFLFWRNIIALGASVALFGLFASLGEALRFTVTAPLVQF